MVDQKGVLKQIFSEYYLTKNKNQKSLGDEGKIIPLVTAFEGLVKICVLNKLAIIDDWGNNDSNQSIMFYSLNIFWS